MFLLVFDNIKYQCPHHWNPHNAANDIEVQSLLNYKCTEWMLEALLTCDVYKSQRCTKERLGTLSIKNFWISHWILKVTLNWLRKKKKEAHLILLKRKITNHLVLPTTTQFPPFPLYTEINTLKLASNGNLAHSLGNANTWINNLNYANTNLKFAICLKKLKELLLIGLSMSRHYSSDSGLAVSSLLQAQKKSLQML